MKPGPGTGDRGPGESGSAAGMPSRARMNFLPPPPPPRSLLPLTFPSPESRPSRYPVTGPRSRLQTGYTLIEVIVAFALLALALTLLLGTLSGSARQVRWSGDAGRAALHAQSLLDQVGITEPLEPGERRGEFEEGRYRWTLDVAPWNDPSLPPEGPQPLAPSAPQLYELSLDVEWGSGGSGERLALRSLRMVQPGLQDRGAL